MPIIEARNRLEDARIAHDMDTKSEYARICIKLDDPDMIGENIELMFNGHYISKIRCDGVGVYFRFDTRHNGKIYVDEFQEAHKEFEKIYLTNATSQSGKELVLQVGTRAEIKTHLREEHMRTAYLNQDGDGVGSNFGTPGAGRRFVVLGYQIIETEKANMVVAVDGRASLKFVTSDRTMWRGIGTGQGAVTNYLSHAENLYVIGGINEVITLTNANVSAGTSEVQAVIFYRIIVV